MPSENKEYFYLQPKEEAAMKVLWNTEDALSASEIAQRIENRSWPASSIQGILRNLEKKGAIKVEAITKLGKSYGRLFRPSMSANEYAVMQFLRYYQPEKSDCYAMLSSLLGSARIAQEEIIASLQELLEEHQKKEHT